MLIKSKPGWLLPDSAATPEALFHDRRRLIKGLAAGSILAAGGSLLAACEDSPDLMSTAVAADDPTADLYPAPRNERYVLDRPITDENLATTYNNFYEFGSHKNIWKAAQKLQIRPWEVVIDGMVENPMTLGVDDLIRSMDIEERLYRHRCVERWSMAVPWSGFSLKSLVEMAAPLSGAKYLRMTGFHAPELAPGQRQTVYPWPYVEGLTLAEATNELSLIVTGAYGKPLPKQNGAPLRLAVPWKYGFKHIKSIQRFTFTDERPVSFWEEIGPTEYGFWANVSPFVPHPRWTQAREKLLGSNEEIKTLLYNGYEEFVAHLYEGMDDQKLFT